MILSLAISSSNDRLAVTSDTNTLHIFDLPIHSHSHSHSQSQSQTQSKLNPARITASTSRSPTPDPAPSPQNKYGTLSRLPFAPRVLTDTYSTCSCAFTPSNPPSPSSSTSNSTNTTTTDLASATSPFTKDARGRYRQEEQDGFVDIVPGVPGGSPPKGVAAWIDEERVVVVSAGRGGRYERFALRDRGGGRGGIEVFREGWCAFLGDL